MQTTFMLHNGKVQPSPDPLSPIMILVNPDEGERRRLVEEFGLDDHTIHSSLDPDELSRIEHNDDHFAVIYKRPQYERGKDPFLFHVASAGIFMFRDRMIVISSEPVQITDAREGAGNLNAVLLRLIYTSIIHFREHLRVINQISDDLQVKIARAMENRVLLNMFSIQKSLEYYLNAISSNALLLEKLKFQAGRIELKPEQLETLDDIIIENNQCAKQAEIYANILASLMDARASIVSNNLNVLMKTLNIITIAIMVPTFVVSAFSMNVGIPLQSHPLAFYIIMSLALMSVAGVVALWRIKKW